ncbi:olfactory receptor 1496-like [Bombina bombina]|uniref:olfactory receptor 1496-like n=1 Tax=Bombina bombina TaxID=8345 RepID=UPI00235AB295|nr:olfactory receptor 1496-like [Bombina bombina]
MGIITSQLMRVIRNNSEVPTMIDQLTTMEEKLVARGYDKGTVRKVKEELLKDPKCKGHDKPKKDTERLNFVTTYTPTSDILKKSAQKNWPILETDPTLPFNRMQPPRMVYRRAENLRDVLVKTDPVRCYQKDNWLKTSKNGCYTCETISSVFVKNQTSLREFHLKTFSISKKTSPLVFTGVLVLYLLAVLGNLVIIALVCLVSQLQTPMYFFLSSLSVQDIIYISTILPKLLAITITGDTSISFSGCIIQVFVFILCIDAEFFLLTSMAYDRYVAICIPLRYSLIMNKNVCALLIAVCWVISFLNSFFLCLILSHLAYCKEQEINNFFCDSTILLTITCSDITYIFTLYMPIEFMLLGCFPFVLIIVSYICIIFTILKIRTSSGRLKTFSSCSSHLTVVILFYGTSLGLNMKPKSENSLEIDKLLSMLYIGVVPLVNPLVYSLRNKEVLQAMKSLLKIHF